MRYFVLNQVLGCICCILRQPPIAFTLFEIRLGPSVLLGQQPETSGSDGKLSKIEMIGNVEGIIDNDWKGSAITEQSKVLKRRERPCFGKPEHLEDLI